VRSEGKIFFKKVDHLDGFPPVGIEDGINPQERMIRNIYEKLPQELKERGAFCLWKYEERDGSRTKVPYQPNSFRADSANKATFTDYAIAVRHRAGYDGIGIGVFGDICAIDIDSCVEDGVLSDMAEDIIARMDTYTEYSPSGTGVRILFKASLPAYDKDRYYINNRQIKLEVYE
jgi:putative DNA primase/helicase